MFEVTHLSSLLNSFQVDKFSELLGVSFVFARFTLFQIVLVHTNRLHLQPEDELGGDRRFALHKSLAQLSPQDRERVGL